MPSLSRIVRHKWHIFVGSNSPTIVLHNGASSFRYYRNCDDKYNWKAKKTLQYTDQLKWDKRFQFLEHKKDQSLTLFSRGVISCIVLFLHCQKHMSHAKSLFATVQIEVKTVHLAYMLESSYILQLFPCRKWVLPPAFWSVPVLLLIPISDSLSWRAWTQYCTPCWPFPGIPATAPKCSLGNIVGYRLPRSVGLSRLLVEVDKMGEEAADKLLELVIPNMGLNWVHEQVEGQEGIIVCHKLA